MAAGDTLVGFTAQQAVAVATNGALRRTRNAHPVLRFADAVTRRAIFADMMPRHYGGGSIAVTLVWAAETDTVTTNGVSWRVAFERLQQGGPDIDVDDFAGTKAIVGAPQSVAGKLTYTSVTFSNADADLVAAGNAFRLYVERGGADVDDTLTGAADLFAIELREV